MRLLNTNKQQTYSINWSSEIYNYFTEKLSTMYCKEALKALLEVVLNQVEIRSPKFDLAISLDDKYYELTDQRHLNPIDLHDNILPHSMLKDDFLVEIFESKDWAECIRNAKPEESYFQVIEIKENGTAIGSHDDVSMLDKCLSEYFSEDFKKTVEDQFLALLSIPANSLGILKFLGEEYSLVESDNSLHVMNHTVKSESILMILKEALHNVNTPIIDSIYTRLWNILVFHCDLILPIRITKITELSDADFSWDVSYLLTEAIWYAPTGIQYKCFKIETHRSPNNDLGQWYAAIIETLDNNLSRYGRKITYQDSVYLELSNLNKTLVPPYILNPSPETKFLDLNDYYSL